MEKLKTILVDDNETFRQALKSLLIKEYNAEIFGEASSADEFWKIKDYHHADIIFMDVMMPGTDGISLTRKALWNFKNLKIIAITMHNDRVYLTSLLEAGFMGCIFKSNLFNELGPALNEVMDGKRFFPENILLHSKNEL